MSYKESSKRETGTVHISGVPFAETRIVGVYRGLEGNARGGYFYRQGDVMRKLSEAPGSDDFARDLKRYAQEPVYIDGFEARGDAWATWARRTASKLEHRAENKSLDFDLNADAIIKMLDAQKCKCALTGMTFTSVKDGDAARAPFGPSIDRINNSKGYTLDNVRIVTAMANLARANFTDAEFHKMCAQASMNKRLIRMQIKEE